MPTVCVDITWVVGTAVPIAPTRTMRARGPCVELPRRSINGIGDAVGQRCLRSLCRHLRTCSKLVACNSGHPGREAGRNCCNEPEATHHTLQSQSRVAVAALARYRSEAGRNCCGNPQASRQTHPADPEWQP